MGLALSMLLLLAFVGIRTLMRAVAREDVSRPMPETADLAPLLRATRDEDVRAFLLPAAADPTTTPAPAEATDGNMPDGTASDATAS